MSETSTQEGFVAASIQRLDEISRMPLDPSSLALLFFSLFALLCVLRRRTLRRERIRRWLAKPEVQRMRQLVDAYRPRYASAKRELETVTLSSEGMYRFQRAEELLRGVEQRLQDLQQVEAVRRNTINELLTSEDFAERDPIYWDRHMNEALLQVEHEIIFAQHHMEISRTQRGNASRR